MDPVSAREELYQVFAGSEGDVETKVDRALDIGTDYFDLPVGFFTHIDEERQTIVRAVGDHELIQPGQNCPLEEAYCQRTLESDDVLAIQDVGRSSIPEKAVQVFDLGTYIGAKIVVDDAVYGTICFADQAERDQPFSEAEELFIELMANLVGSALERRDHERLIEARNERLSQEKQRFEGIAENSFDILFRVDLEARFSYVSSAVEHILGYDPEDLTGEPFQEFISDSTTPVALSAYADLLKGEPREGLELDFLTPSEEVVTLEVNATPITDEGTVVGVQGVGRDVTARRERERELRIKNRAMDESEVGITITDPHQPDNPLVYVNKGFERVTGYDTEEMLGENCRFLQGPATDSAATDQFRAAIEAREASTAELVNYRKDGMPFWNRVQLNPVFDDAGELGHYLGFQTDVTERRRTEKLIQLLNRVLRHNLRNDMNAINGWATTVQNAGDESIVEAGDRIERISRQLTELSETARELEQQAHRERDPQRLDLPTLVRDAVDPQRERFPSAAFEVRIETERAVCAGPELETALGELVENAAKHATDPTVEVVARDDDEWIEFTVTDDGPGIDEMERNVVSAGGETALEHGSGLGLWVVNWIVTRYGGSFQLTSRSERTGTVATIRLPAIGTDQSVASVQRGPTLLLR